MPYPTKTTPNAILEVALQLLETGGADGLTMRSLAEALGIKAPSLYRHYADRATLEMALVAHGATQLHTLLEGIDAGTPETRLRQAADRYREFAHAYPALYALMMQPQATSGAPKTLWNTVLALTSAVTQRDDDTAAAVALWAFLHGFVSLEHQGAFGASGPRAGFATGLEALMVGLEQIQPADKLICTPFPS